MFKNNLFNIIDIVSTYTVRDFLLFFNGSVFFLLLVLIAFVFKLAFLKMFFLKKTNTERFHSWYLMISVLISAITIDCAWIMKLVFPFFTSHEPGFLALMIRIGWIGDVILYQSIILLVDTLSDRQLKIRWYTFVSILPSGLIILVLGGMSFGRFVFLNDLVMDPFEMLLFRLIGYHIYFIIIPSVVFCFYKSRDSNIPQILRNQQRALFWGFVLPFFFVDFIFSLPFMFLSYLTLPLNLLQGLNTIFFSFAFYSTMRKMFNLRFLNFAEEVRAPKQIKFFEDFDIILQKLSIIKKVEELQHIVNLFFKDLLDIPSRAVSLHVRHLDSLGTRVKAPDRLSMKEKIFEQFVAEHSDDERGILVGMQEMKILLRDEMTFTEHYEQSDQRQIYLELMEKLKITVLLPLYADGLLVGYITIDDNVETDRMYHNVEQRQMVIFAGYVGQMVMFERAQDIKSMVLHSKQLADNLYKEHQENKQYRETIDTFMHQRDERRVGILYSNGRNFSFANEQARKLVEIDPNQHYGHILSKSLKKIVQNVMDYRSAQSMVVYNGHGEKLVLDAFPHLDKNLVVVTVARPEIADIIQNEKNLLKDPSEWDYLLYLQTTEVGKLVNKLLPGIGPQILNFKIKLLKCALNKRALMLSMAEKDLYPAVELIHSISLREHLQMVDLKAPEENLEAMIKLFGINPLFGNTADRPLLEHLTWNGTLYIKNIHFLHMDTQKNLSDFLASGMYRMYKSDKRYTSGARVIVSSHQSLKDLVEQGVFSAALYDQLKDTQITLPSVVSLPEQEVSSLIQAIANDSVINPALQGLVQVSPQETEQFVQKRAESLFELKEKVYTLLSEKAKEVQTSDVIEFDPALRVHDAQLIDAKRLGKRSLSDPQVMAMLWRKFEKSQTQIAMFLGVNRSSVNRRCKEYGLI